MGKKIAFLDIDGTLSLMDGTILESSIYACTKARANGHKIYLCTGRSKHEVFGEIWDIGFDGLIGAGGAHIEVGNQVLLHRTLSLEQCQQAVDFFDEKRIDFFLECDSGIYTSKYFLPVMEKIVYGDICEAQINEIKQRNEYHPFLALMTSGETNLYRDDVNKISFLGNNTIDISEIKARFENEFSIIGGSVDLFGKNSGELGALGINKASAIKVLLEHIDGSIDNCYAIGDGINDLEMFECCAKSVAMGNAHPEIKAIADFVVSSNEENGVYEAFEYLGLLD